MAPSEQKQGSYIKFLFFFQKQI